MKRIWLMAGVALAGIAALALAATGTNPLSLAEALSVLGHITPRSLDAVAAFGEQLSSLLVTAAFTLQVAPRRSTMCAATRVPHSLRLSPPLRRNRVRARAGSSMRGPPRRWFRATGTSAIPCSSG